MLLRHIAKVRNNIHRNVKMNFRLTLFNILFCQKCENRKNEIHASAPRGLHTSPRHALPKPSKTVQKSFNHPKNHPKTTLVTH